MTVFLLALLFVIVLIVIVGITLYNQLVKLTQMVAEGWSGIDVQLKKRSNLIPNLVETVKGYLTHERDLLEKVTELRSQSMRTNDPAKQARIEGSLGRALANILAVAENYPDLKANTNFLDLQDELSAIENDIEMARRYYNGTVRNLNIKVESFPSNIVADKFGFKTAEFFELDDPQDREVPSVSFEN
jgi:LemA protein